MTANTTFEIAGLTALTAPATLGKLPAVAAPVALGLTLALSGGSFATASQGSVSSSAPTIQHVAISSNSSRRYGLLGYERKLSDYSLLHEAIRTLAFSTQTSVSEAVADNAIRVLALLHVFDRNAPKVTSQDEDQVTFVWRDGDVAHYLTTGEEEISYLISTPEKVDIIKSSAFSDQGIVDVLTTVGGNGGYHRNSTHPRG